MARDPIVRPRTVLHVGIIERCTILNQQIDSMHDNSNAVMCYLVNAITLPVVV